MSHLHRISRPAIEREAAQLLKRAGVGGPPVDVEKVAAQLSIRVEQADLDEDCSGILIRSDEDGAVIGVNWDHHPNRQRFTIAHEIGHFLLHKGGTFIDKGTYARFRDQQSGSGTVSEEKQANQFAAALLMPAEWVKEAFKAHPFDPADGSALQDLADAFQVSTQAVMFRISNMGLLNG